MIFQFHHLLRDFTVLDNVGDARTPAESTRRGRGCRRGARCSDRVGLIDACHRYPAELSGGESATGGGGAGAGRAAGPDPGR